MKRPLEFAEGERKSAEGDIAIGPRIAQALGLAGQVGRHFRQQVRLIEIECVAQFEAERAADDVVAGNAEFEDGGRLAVKIGALFNRDENQAGLLGGGFDGCDERSFQIGGHSGILRWRLVQIHSTGMGETVNLERPCS